VKAMANAADQLCGSDGTDPLLTRLPLPAWEEKRIALAEAALDALVAPAREEVGITDLLPQPKRRRQTGVSGE